jgi:hypothetical protein
LKEQSIKDYNATTDPVEKAKISNQLQSTLATLVNTNMVKREFASKEITGLAEQMQEINVIQRFKQDPIGTLKALDGGEYSKDIPWDKQETLKNHLASSYREAQADVERATRLAQEKNFADLMVQARKNQLTQQQIDAASLPDARGFRRINAEQAIHLTNQRKATAASGGVDFSNPRVLADLEYGLHGGPTPTTVEGIRNQQQAGQLTVDDANRLYLGVEQAKLHQKENDVSHDPQYLQARNYISSALPNADRLDMDHQFRIMVGQAHVDFDKMARSTDEKGNPKYQPKDFQGLAENIVDGTLQKMNLEQNAARSRLLPGIKTPQDVADAVRSKRISPEQAKEQMRLLQILGVGLVTVPTGTPADRNAAARAAARGQGVK